MKSLTLSILVALYVLCVNVKGDVLAKNNPTEINWTECTKDEDCTSIPNSTCDFDVKQDCGIGVCNCRPTHVSIEAGNTIECLPKANQLGDACTNNVQCSSNLGETSLCTVGTCQCPSTADVCNGRCMSKRKLGDSCTFNCECNQEKGAICDGATNRCVCHSGELFVEVPNSDDECMKSAALIGGPCEQHPEQCLKHLRNAICEPNSKTCQCDNSTHVIKNGGVGCIPKQFYLNEKCEKSDQCVVENSHCDPNTETCQCDAMYVEGKIAVNSCLEKTHDYGEPCTEDVQCADFVSKFSECREGKCVCKPGYVYDNDSSDYCDPSLQLNEWGCYSDSQCFDASGSNALTRCNTSRICDCAYNSFQYNGVCYQRREIGDSCDSDAQCKASIEGGAICKVSGSQGVCQCDTGYVPNSTNRFCLQTNVPHGGRCRENSQCYGYELARESTRCQIGVGDEVGTCDCTNGYTYDESRLICNK